MMNKRQGIRTLEEAHAYVKAVKVCTIYHSARSGLPSLWEAVDLPEKQPGERGWGRKVEAVWTWKNALPARYPEEIFYGKIKGGFAILMEMHHLRTVHFPRAHQPVAALSELARLVYEEVRLEPWNTTGLRQVVLDRFPSTKSRVDTALKQLQMTLNVVRSIDPEVMEDIWLPFKEVYPEIWREHVG